MNRLKTNVVKVASPSNQSRESNRICYRSSQGGCNSCIFWVPVVLWRRGEMWRRRGKIARNGWIRAWANGGPAGLPTDKRGYPRASSHQSWNSVWESGDREVCARQCIMSSIWQRDDSGWYICKSRSVAVYRALDDSRRWTHPAIIMSLSPREESKDWWSVNALPAKLTAAYFFNGTDKSLCQPRNTD